MPTVRPRTTQYLWEFLLELLDGKESCAAISWVNRDKGEFVLKDQSVIAELWGKVKGRPRMDKIKLGRAMRYYYKKKLLAKVPKRKAVYRFIKFDCLYQEAGSSDKLQQCAWKEKIPEGVAEIDFSEVNTLDLMDEDATSLSNDDDGYNDTPLEDLLLYNEDKLADQLVPPSLFPKLADQLVPPSLFPKQLTETFSNHEVTSSYAADCHATNYNNNNISYCTGSSSPPLNNNHDHLHQLRPEPDITSKYPHSCRFSEYAPTTTTAPNLNYYSSPLTTTVTSNSNTTDNQFTSLLVKSMFIVDPELDLSSSSSSSYTSTHTTPHTLYNNSTPISFAPPGGSATTTCTRQAHITAVGTQPSCLTDNDIELTLNALREFERMVMLSSI